MSAYTVHCTVLNVFHVLTHFIFTITLPSKQNYLHICQAWRIIIPVHGGQLICMNTNPGNSLQVRWLGLCTFTAFSPSSIPVWTTKISKATWYIKKNKNKQKKTINLGQKTQFQRKPHVLFFLICQIDLKT